ncbi:EGF-like module-containing mucin-like hormone receptor-like 1 [Stylophora pistillata]|uniref:EGF-like module-containing mucin-like hormone receptor-like 1 n=1 Tax=Stylophora pistillata TaxID=50429 RepID=A0A2B4RKN8_STYPI|nr:EGF-like module-containing mucin-like hormone receptor-like 1 [Stylophora pistillata]
MLNGFAVLQGLVSLIDASQSSDKSAKYCPIFNFEHGADDWSKQGTAFIHQPVFGGSSNSDHQGNWLIDTHRNVTTPCQRQSSSLGKQAKGTMTSPLFLIRSPSLSFLIGGGCDFQTVRMEIVVNGSTVISRTGSCQPQLTRTKVNLQQFVGSMARVKLVDMGTGNWGYIAFDDLRHETTCEALSPCNEEHRHLCQTKEIHQNTDYTCTCNQALPYLPTCQSNDSKNNCNITHGTCNLSCNDTKSNCQCRQCTCVTGYKFKSSNQSCQDIDECQLGTHDCQHTCINTEGGYQCSCLNGYQLNGDGRSCRDNKECSTNNGGCDHVCVNTIGSFYCVCNQGWSAKKFKCVDNDECQGYNLCEHTCVNTPGSYRCECRSGYTRSGTQCQDIDECSINKGGCQVYCTNTPGSFKCSCEHGFQIANDGKTCEDIDECNLGRSGCQQVCVNTPGSYNCSCLGGFELQKDQRSCLDINECQLNEHGCQQQCNNSPGGYDCSCLRGYQLSSDKKNCSDVNECLQDNGECSQDCVNTPGSYNCLCRKGYRRTFDEQNCNKSLSCSNNASCTECSETNCEDINECDNSSICEHKCHNTDGSYRCSCRDGYRLTSDLRVCEDVDECLQSSAMGCVSCKNTLGGFHCSCATGYSFNNEIKKCEERKPLGATLAEGKQKIAQAEDAAAVISATSHIADEVKGLKKMSSEELTETVDVLENVKKLQVNAKSRQTFFNATVFPNSPHSVKIPSATVKDRNDNDSVGISVALLKGMANVLSNGSSDGRSGSNDLNSIIVIVMVTNVNPDHLANLKEPVVLRFEHLKRDSREQQCSFLNETAIARFPKDPSKHWSSVGCYRNYSTEEITICHCYHLTSYGLIMDVHGIYDELSEAHKETLKYISLVGCCVSIFFCLLSIFGFSLAMRKPRETKARRETYRLHINLVLAICLSQMCFVIGTIIISVDVLACRIVSIATHYFLGASFCWMLAEGIHIYNKIVRVFSNKKYNKVFYVLGWGAPILLVSASTGLSFHEYGPHNICWLSGKLIWVFAAPVLVVIAINCFILVSVIYVLLRKTMVKAGEENSAKKSNIRRSVKVTVVLLPLLGLTWVFGFMAVDRNTIFFHYIFAIANSLQGLFIFFAHCWINETVREALTQKSPSFSSRGKYNIRRKPSDNRLNSVSLETATPTTTSVRLVRTNSRQIKEPPPLKLVNLKQELASARQEQIDDNSVRLTNFAKLPPKYADMLVDAPASRLFSVSKPSMKITSLVNNVSPNEYPITPKEAYDNPTYAYWKGRGDSD